jgi:glycine hydroxymethyltransferase
MQKDTQVFDLINKELERQRNGIELIAFGKFCFVANPPGNG